ncbi:hypothetical protein BBJ29_003906 [Phytophthora kernoviae]|uniref:DNA-directed RNA polymerase I subunit RPA49 n=1 Tax=Phytophthora kernoviae TaxID=325452 RepID=A0A3F2RIB6_9STRA|nr:hypothetical protein BBJ29_003906 [Phytophthora kernoviae]RLN57707.1 hypothetical protein BBP00_00007394 [Phytophthora kernoviae]
MSKRVKVHLQHQTAFDNAAPVVATFRNGPPPQNQRQDLEFEMFEHPAKKQRLVVASSEKVAYQGANFGYLGSSHDFSNYAVGVYDKDTKEVRLCNVDQIYVMQQAIKGSSENVDENRGEGKSFMEQRRDLVEVFGSKKSKRMQKNREENIVDLEHISGATSVSQTLQKKITAAQRTLEEERARDANYSSEAAALASTRNAILPPCDIDAPTPERVYDLRKFMDGSVMDSLTIMAEEVIEALSNTNVAEYAASLNLASLPTRLLLSLPTPYDVTKVSHVVYVSYLVDFFNAHFPMRKSAAVISEEKGIPLVIVRHFLKLFTDVEQGNNGFPTYLQPKPKKDKLILYLLVVALTANGFSLDLTEVGADLKRSTMSLTTYCRQLGCVVEKVKSDTAVYGGASSLASKKMVHRVVLAVPLHFPPPKRGGGPRR